MKTLILGTILLGFFSCQTSKMNECIEVPKEDCICTRQYEPVCGCNGTTYSNPCEAECHGINNYTRGECETTK